MAIAKSAGQMSLYACDSYTRRVSLRDQFDDEATIELCSKLRQLDKLSCTPIVLDIDSNGGDYHSGERLAACIEGLGSPVFGIVYNRCFSTAVVVLQACRVRAALPNAKFLFHNNFKVVNIKITPDSELRVLIGMLIQEIKKREIIREEVITNMVRRVPTFSPSDLLRLMKENEPTPKLIPADEAVLLGFLDGIVQV